MKYDVIIIGGGAAGLTAALSASRLGAAPLILEAAPRIGRKILASGNGRCNLANTGAPRFYGDAALAESIVGHYPAEQVLAFFAGLGLATAEEEGGRVYPACGQAAAVLDVLRSALERRRIPILTQCPAQEIVRTGPLFQVKTAADTFAAPCVIAACGGMAGGKLGHNGDAYGLLTRLGHRLVSPRPALTQLISEKSAVKGLSGLRLPARLTLCNGRQPVSAAQGEVLFTDYGVSGVCAMQLSREADRLSGGGRAMLYIDFSPTLGLTERLYDRIPAENPWIHEKMILACLKERLHILPEEALLCGLVPRLLAERLRGLSPEKTAALLAAFPVPITGVRGFDSAQVTAGGLSGEDFSPQTLESRKIPGLYAAGEMLDVDGDCGGYNLLFAFASGLTAGEAAARQAKQYAAAHPKGGR